MATYVEKPLLRTPVLQNQLGGALEAIHMLEEIHEMSSYNGKEINFCDSVWFYGLVIL